MEASTSPAPSLGREGGWGFCLSAAGTGVGQKVPSCCGLRATTCNGQGYLHRMLCDAAASCHPLCEKATPHVATCAPAPAPAPTPAPTPALARKRLCTACQPGEVPHTAIVWLHYQYVLSLARDAKAHDNQLQTAAAPWAPYNQTHTTSNNNCAGVHTRRPRMQVGLCMHLGTALARCPCSVTHVVRAKQVHENGGWRVRVGGPVRHRPQHCHRCEVCPLIVAFLQREGGAYIQSNRMHS